MAPSKFDRQGQMWISRISDDARNALVVVCRALRRNMHSSRNFGAYLTITLKCEPLHETAAILLTMQSGKCLTHIT